MFGQNALRLGRLALCLIQPGGPKLPRLAQRGLLPLSRFSRGKELRQLRFDASPCLGDMAYLRFQPRYLGVGAVQLSLRGVQRVADGVVLGTRQFELLLDFPQPGRLGLEFDAAKPLRSAWKTPP